MAEHEGQNRNTPVAGLEVSTAPTAGVKASGEQAFDAKSSGVEASGKQVPLGQAFGASASGKHLPSKGKEGKLPIALLLLSFLMAVVILFYVLLSTTDVLYSDYIRLVNSYLGKPFQLGDLLQKDILTRIPLTYVFREINRHFFGYTWGTRLISNKYSATAFYEKKAAVLFAAAPVFDSFLQPK